MSLKRHTITILIGVLLCASTHADIINLNNIDAGYIQKQEKSFSHTSGSAYAQKHGNTDSNSYYVFDLSGVSGPITNATFDSTGGWQSGSPMLNLFQVSS